jgi:hypothetical protein
MIRLILQKLGFIVYTFLLYLVEIKIVKPYWNEIYNSIVLFSALVPIAFFALFVYVAYLFFFLTYWDYKSKFVI